MIGTLDRLAGRGPRLERPWRTPSVHGRGADAMMGAGVGCSVGRARPASELLAPAARPQGRRARRLWPGVGGRGSDRTRVKASTRRSGGGGDPQRLLSARSTLAEAGRLRRASLRGWRSSPARSRSTCHSSARIAMRGIERARTPLRSALAGLPRPAAHYYLGWWRGMRHWPGRSKWHRRVLAELGR